MPAFDIDLTLDSLKIPNINGTFPFGTKITPTAENKGGLSTAEVNSNIMLPFAQMRPKVCSDNSTTSQVEYDAKIVFNAPTGVTPSAGYTLTMGNGTYVGCTVTYTNLMEYACTVKQSDGTTTLFSVSAGKTMSAMWNGTAWLWTTTGSVTANDPTPVSSAAVHAAIGDIKERIVVNYAASSTAFKCTRSTPWSISGSKTGYYPLVINYIQGWSGLVLSEVEQITRNNGSFSMRGTASAVYTSEEDFNAYAQVVWVKL